MEKFLLDKKFSTQEQINLLAEVVNTSISGITLYKAVRDENGIIQDFKVLLANNMAAKIMNCTIQDLHDKTAFERHPTLKQTSIFEWYVDAIETNTSKRDELIFDNVWYDVSVTKLGDGMLVNFLNITNRKLNEKKLIEHSEELEKKSFELQTINENLKQFAYAASHDLQEPLRKISTFIDMLEQDNSVSLADFSITLIKKLKDSVTRMGSLIKNLLSYSHLINGSNTDVDISLNELLQQVLIDLELTISESNTKVVINNLPTIKGSKHQLTQLFLNLLTNAIKFRKSDSGHEIYIDANKVNSEEMECLLMFPVTKYLKIDISDNGIGFDEKHKEKIFQPFTKLHATGSKYSGTGIGLALVQKIVENHKGCIEVKSTLDIGSTFSIYLPIR